MRVELLSITAKAEELIEAAGRTSHKSNKRTNDESRREFIIMLIRKGHYSVLEHANASFRITGISRALSHQLVRHRLCSYTQSSQRYVNEKAFGVVKPPSIIDNQNASNLFDDLMASIHMTYIKLQELGIKNEDARFVLPNATETEIVMTANLREWRHILELRGAPQAQWEIRKMAIEILRILKQKAPSVFADYEIDEQENAIIHSSNL